MSNSVSLAQKADSAKTHESRLFVLPVVFSTPETSWGFGASAIYTFSPGGPALSSRPSQLQLAAIYTLKNQLLLYLPYAFYLQENRYRIQGELGYYRYSYSYFGIGNNTNEESEEIYDANYPRIIASVSKKVFPDLYIGLRYWFDDYHIVNIEPGGNLNTREPEGLNGRVNSGIALTLLYESRDNIFYSRKGSFAEFILHADRSWLGSDFTFTTYSLDLRTFHTNRWDHTLGLNLFGSFSSSATPFYRLSLLGGPNRMRGYMEGRYRDKHYLTFQATYRMPVYKRFGLATFMGIGQVASSINDFGYSDLKVGSGAGVRYMLDTQQKLNIRLDYGLTPDGSAFYLTFSEAF